MSLNDPISSVLTHMRNAVLVRKETVDVPASKLTGKILDIFKNQGYRIRPLGGADNEQINER